MKNIKFSRLFAAAMLVACFAFAGCKPQNDELVLPENVRYLTEEDKVIGAWVSTWGENWSITKTTLDTGTGSYAGNTILINMETENSGRMFMKYTRAQEKTTSEPTGADASTWTYVAVSAYNPTAYWYRYTTTAPDVGKWYAIRFKELTDSAAQMAGAYKAGGATSKDTLEEAIAEFTVANGYYSDYSTFAKE